MKNRRHIRRAFSIAIAVSVGLHLLPFAYFTILNDTPRTKAAHTIEVEMLDSRTTAAGPNASIANRAVSARRSAPSKDISSGGFRQRHIDRVLDSNGDVAIESSSRPNETASEDAFPHDPMANVKSAGHGWSGAVQYGNAMGLQFTLENLNFFEALHARVNSQLIYPDDFSRQRITGRVRIEAELGRDGKLVRFTSTVADDRLLQTYCFAILMQILNHPLPERAWLDTERTIVAFDFDFYTRVRHNIPRTLPLAVEKNRLAFARESEIDPWLNEKISEIFTHYIPPIIPIPGGVYIDLVLAYQYVNNLLNDAPTESELRQERLTKLHQLLRTALKVHGMEPQPSPTPMPEG